MAEFSKKTLEFLDAVGGDHRKFLAPIPTSPDRMIPGNLLIFRYTPLEGEYFRDSLGRFSTNQRVILVVKCKRGDGVFPGKSGKLVSCFKLHSVDGPNNSEVVVQTILENLYNKRRRASYYGRITPSLIKLLGKHVFHTYRVNGMNDLWKFSLGPQKVRFD